jgi:hypothetical protein
MPEPPTTSSQLHQGASRERIVSDACAACKEKVTSDKLKAGSQLSVANSDCFAHRDSSFTLQRHARKDAHNGGSGAWTLRAPAAGRASQPRRTAALRATSPPLPTFSGGGSWAEPFVKTAHRRIPTEGVRFRASPSGFRPPLLVPGLFWFRARVILLTDEPTPTSGTPLPQRSDLPTETSLPLHPTRP